ncbi:MAG: UDP-N-acetylglucosamine 2-epimerase (non-hydrolyzing) [Tannerella sp.]|jgi:UDP-GlcNAc3NAcA epimerase|nr:UDP-N-acetylglucosamine 2-epimerase (non-hydrolyzing) [Tannerella sp.]
MQQLKIITIVGARPQFVKAAIVSRAIINHNRSVHPQIIESILHTGQHYDVNMNAVFFNKLEIPHPTWSLDCGGGSHAAMTARMMIEIEKILLENRPDYVLVYGDTNSTLAGALTAAKLHIPVAHVEAGLRSFNRRMPEEINRVVTDHLSTLLFCPTSMAVSHLKNEGITQGVFNVGDVMYDAALTFGEIAENKSTILSDLQLNTKQFYLCTVHRAENTDNSESLSQIMQALLEIARPDFPVIFPLHPRTKKILDDLYPVNADKSLRLIEPVDYLDMLILEKHAKTILTDSGGIQKEAYFHRTPCITLRNETEWVETVNSGWNQLAGHTKENILHCLHTILQQTEIQEYGDGHAADNIIQTLLEHQNE